MGDRGTVRIVNDETSVSMYLHWDGELASVYALAQYCRAHGYRCEDDITYGMARLVGVACNYIGVDNGLSVGVASEWHEDWDNGNYTITDDWRITGWDKQEKFADDFELKPYTYYGKEGQEIVPKDMVYVRKLMMHIDESMPVKGQLGKELIDKWCLCIMHGYDPREELDYMLPRRY